MSWALCWLSQNPEFQQNLRQEILKVKLSSEEDELEYDNIPLLNALIKVNSERWTDAMIHITFEQETLRYDWDLHMFTFSSKTT
jgi:cytochrome P450